MSKKAVLSRAGALCKGALVVYLQPKLALDASIDLAPVLAKITKANFKQSQPALLAGLKRVTEGKLAQNATLDDAPEIIAALDEVLPDDDDIAEDEDDSDDEDKKKKQAEDEDDDEETDKSEQAKDTLPEGVVTKGAMDEAIKAAVAKANADAARNQREIRDAERAVRPYVGDLAMAHDSADGVYKTALTTLGVNVDNVHPSAFPAILAAQPKPGAKPAQTARVAMDSASSASFASMFPDAAKIGHA